MSQKQILTRHSTIINMLRRYPTSWKNISDKLESESEASGYDLKVDKRTFDRDRESILSLYGIDIVYNSASRKYEITSLEVPGTNDHLLEAIDTLNALSYSQGLSGRLHFEERRPKGTEHLNGLLHSIRVSLKVRITYQKYWEEALSNYLLDPLALKEYRSRWYLIALDNKDRCIKSFALDRLTELVITHKGFKLESSFNIDTHYKHCFGIMSPNEAGHEEIILSFNTFQGKYIKNLPLHTSQQILVDNEQEIRVSLEVFITFDFIMELLSYGANVRVIKPERLKIEMKNTYLAAARQYEAAADIMNEA